MLLMLHVSEAPLTPLHLTNSRVSPSGVGERTAVPAPPRPVTSTAAPQPTVTVLRQARPGQSILIPVNIKGSGNIKTVKILSAPGNLKVRGGLTSQGGEL